jgi:two-component system chemotaxis response regulator CheB
MSYDDGPRPGACTPRADSLDSTIRPLGGALFPAAAFDAVVIAASLGGREVLERLLGALPVDFPAPVLVVQHQDPRSPGYLPELLARRTRLLVRHAEAGERLRAATVYVAPPGRHLLVDPDGRCALSEGPRVSFARPSADRLFASAAAAFGARVLGVVLTGRLFDGTAGAAEIRRAGGVVLAQEPGTCRAPDMPRAAMRSGAVHLALPPAALGAAVHGLVAVPGVPALFGLRAATA